MKLIDLKLHKSTKPVQPQSLPSINMHTVIGLTLQSLWRYLNQPARDSGDWRYIGDSSGRYCQ